MSVPKENINACLYIVPTPIGNLDDITIRAVKILNEVDIIACEDTRTTGNLLFLLKIKPKKLVSYHNYNEQEKASHFIEEILIGKSVALLSDAGTPAISDPGYTLVKEAINNNIKIVPLPGATALIPALNASGLPTNNFTFLGFPPQKKGRKSFLEHALNFSTTTILYESSHRIEKLINELIGLGYADRQISVSRELTKLFEEHIRGTIAEVQKILNKTQIKGEFVVVIEGKKAK